jgi:hypothetical protein
MAEMSIERLNYFDRQFLRVEDFADEQSYQIAMRRRHNISHHTWGIVEGLEPRLVEGSLFVTPGLAIDGFGRELIVESMQPLPIQSFRDFDTDRLEVWMDYSTTATMPPPKGFAGGGDGAAQFYRVAEQGRVRLAKPSPNSTPRMPASVIPDDRDFNATRAAPEDRNWPIFLGTITSDPKNIDRPFSIDLSQRPYAGLIGEGLTAPSGRARVQIGAENAGDPNRFAVFIPAADPSPRLAIQENGALTVRGETTIQGNLTIGDGGLEIGVGPATSPQPWRVYRVQTDASGAVHNELRVEMEGGGNGNNQVVFGAWSAKDAKFKPCLTIADDGTVTVGGNLVVKGKLDVNPGAVVAGQLSTEAMAYVASGALTSVSLGNIQARVAQPADASPSAFNVETRMRDFAETLAHQDPARLRTFANLMKTEFKEAAANLKKILGE